MRSHFHLPTIIAFCAIGFAPIAHADFTPPKDGKLTEKQVTNYIASLKDTMDILKSAQQAAAGASGTAALAIMNNATQKIEAAKTRNGLSKEEFDWVGEQVGKLWPIAMLQQQWNDSTKPDLEKQIKARQDDSAAQKDKLTTYEQAQKDGKRVMSKDDLDKAIAAATSDRDNIAAEVKTDQDGVKSITDEVAQHDKDAGDDEALAAKPPADVTADQKDGYIDQKKNDAQAAHDAAKDARDRLKEAQASLADANARLAVANGKISHPEIPITDDEKTQVKSDNDQAITDAKAAISADDQAISTLKDTLAAGPPSLGDTKPDPDNLALVQKHVKEYMDAMGVPAPK